MEISDCADEHQFMHKISRLACAAEVAFRSALHGGTATYHQGLWGSASSYAAVTLLRFDDSMFIEPARTGQENRPFTISKQSALSLGLLLS